MNEFNGLGLNLGNLPRLSNAVTRSISAENPTGEKSKGGMALKGVLEDAARELGQGWKISPAIHIKGKQTATLADIQGPGVIQHIWMTVNHKNWRSLILRMYWDGEKQPSVEVPLGDFFCNGWCIPANVSSLPVAVNTRGGLNSYWQMPFRKSTLITLENISEDDAEFFFYQITYSLVEIPQDYSYFHAAFNRSNPLPYKEDHTILDSVKGSGHYVGTYIAWGTHNNGWWGEGEVKMFLDGDEEFPTICGTGTEDYFGGAWCFQQYEKDEYGLYSTPFLGFHQVIAPNNHNQSQIRFGMYRWHIMDPIRFAEDLKVTIQALGWRKPKNGRKRYLPLQDDIASTAFWYQQEPHLPFKLLPDEDQLEVI